MKLHPTLSLSLIALLVITIAFFSLGIGSEHLTWKELLSTAWWTDETHQFILSQFRLPRILAALLAGMALGTSGAVVQTVVRNPLAAPDMLGITGGASVAWLLVLLIFPEVSPSVMPWVAFLGGVTAFTLVWSLTTLIRGSIIELTLIGIAVSVFAGSILRLLTVKFPMKINAGLAWLSGSLWGVDWATISVIWIPLAVLLLLAWSFAKSLDVLYLGEETATHIGLPLRKTRTLLLLIAVATGSMAVSLSGTVGFVGLVAPHLSRRVLGYRHVHALPGAALLGSLLTLIADMIARSFWHPIELPTGLFTAIIGAPYLLYLLARTGDRSS